MKLGEYILLLLIILAPVIVLGKIQEWENMSVGLLLGSTLVPWLLFYLLIEKAKASEKYAMTLYFATYSTYFFFLAVIGMPGLWKVTGIVSLITLIALIADWLGASDKLLKNRND